MRKLESVLGVLGLGDLNARLLDTLNTDGICELDKLRQTTDHYDGLDTVKQAPDRRCTSSTVL